MSEMTIDQRIDLARKALPLCEAQGLTLDQANDLLKTFCERLKIEPRSAAFVLKRDRFHGYLGLTARQVDMNVNDLNKLTNIFDPEGLTDRSEEGMARLMRESLNRALNNRNSSRQKRPRKSLKN